MILKVANVCLETVGRSHLDGEEMLVTLLELLVGGVFREEQPGEILEVVN